MPYVCLWKWSGGARDDYASVISHRKWAPQKRPVIAHIKAKHSLETETAWHLKKKRQLCLIKLVGVPPGLCALAVCV